MAHIIYLVFPSLSLLRPLRAHSARHRAVDHRCRMTYRLHRLGAAAGCPFLSLLFHDREQDADLSPALGRYRRFRSWVEWNDVR